MTVHNVDHQMQVKMATPDPQQALKSNFWLLKMPPIVMWLSCKTRLTVDFVAGTHHQELT
jgi:hypothetical protein